jgi:serine/alanine racemase
MMLKSENFNYKVGSASLNVLNIFYIFSWIGVNAILVRAFSGINIHLDWLIRENLTRIIVPIIFLIASAHFFRTNKRISGTYTKAYFNSLRKGFLIYIIYTGIWTFLYYGKHFFHSFNVFEVLRIIIGGKAPCAWMILAYIVGIGIVILLSRFGISTRNIIILSFFLYLISISTEIYFNLFYSHGLLETWFNIYSKYFVTTRNGVFYGFFWCSIGLASSRIDYDKSNNIRSILLLLFLLFFLLMICEHYYAFVHNWPRDYKSSFMLIPTSLALFIFLMSFNEPSKSYKFFRDCIFIAFLLSPSVRFIVSYIFRNNPFFQFCCLSVVSLGLSYIICKMSKLEFNLFN